MRNLNYDDDFKEFKKITKRHRDVSFLEKRQYENKDKSDMSYINFPGIPGTRNNNCWAIISLELSHKPSVLYKSDKYIFLCSINCGIETMMMISKNSKRHHDVSGVFLEKLLHYLAM